jgi:flagellar P-ring protein precursor FlgI
MTMQRIRTLATIAGLAAWLAAPLFAQAPARPLPPPPPAAPPASLDGEDPPAAPAQPAQRKAVSLTWEGAPVAAPASRRQAGPLEEEDAPAERAETAAMPAAVTRSASSPTAAARRAAPLQWDEPSPSPQPAIGLGETSVVRVKDVATLQGVQPQPLVGYGLVIGLNKTGDKRQTVFPAQSLANMLERFGIVVPADEMKIENIAAVMVTAELPPFARQGARLDITASSIGDARSLQGGTLIPTPLRGPDGRVMALAQGPLSIGGFGGGGKAGNSVQVNHLTVGRVPGGALVQVGQQITIGPAETIQLSLLAADWTNARLLADAVNRELGSTVARVEDAATVSLAVPPTYRTALPDLMARLEPLALTVDTPARIVINERTGTVVVGSHVRIGAAAVAHGNLSVRISTRYNVSQPNPFSQGRGETVVVPEEDVDVQEQDSRLVALNEGTTLDSVVRALNSLGATPRDIIAIMQALKAAGALRAELVII